MTFDGIQFADPWFLALLLVLPLLAFWYYYKQDNYFAKVKISANQGLHVSSWKEKGRHSVQILQILAVAALIVALARPQAILQKENVTAEGIDIMLAIDVSTSMLARDFEPDRLEASKQVAADFVSNRKYDRIGLVVFSGESFTQCPLTTDHNILTSFLSDLQCGLIENGTAIGMGLANATKRLRDSDADSKVIILLTDGINNAGYATPLQAADAARKSDVKVYTIGVGSKGLARTPVEQKMDGSFVYDWRTVHIDEKLLMQIAEQTSGKYFRAQDVDELKAVYDEIDRLETTKIETTVIRRYKEKYHSFVFLALLFVFLQVILANTLFKTIV